MGLDERDLSYVVQVKGTTSAQPVDAAPVTPAYRGMGRPAVARYPGVPTTSLRWTTLSVSRRRTSDASSVER